MLPGVAAQRGHSRVGAQQDVAERFGGQVDDCVRWDQVNVTTLGLPEQPDSTQEP